jgi:putative CRISPR-associated protein (TIGR02619 family)
MERVSAETNTFWRLDPGPRDAVHLLHSDTPSGAECGEALRRHLEENLGQLSVSLHRLPGINFELREREDPALVRLAQVLELIVRGSNAGDHITFAATGGFKAEVMVMAITGHRLGIPVCYVHEAYRSLIYLPNWPPAAPGPARVSAPLPTSGRNRSEVVAVDEGHHAPRSWKAVRSLLQRLPWVDHVRFCQEAQGAPRNGVKAAPRGTNDGRVVLWIHLADDRGAKFLCVETTGHTPEHKEAAAVALREALGRLL